MSIYKKLFEAKKEIGKISKDAKNPFFKSSYLSLNGLINAVEHVLEKHELVLLQPIEAEWVKTKIIDIETGENVRSEMHLPTIQDPQKLGSAITYFRRYTLQSLLGLQAEDDDANYASKPTPVKKAYVMPKTRLLTPSEKLKACKTLKELAEVYTNLKPTDKTATEALKNELKGKLK